MVEAIIVVPILIILGMGVCEFGVYLHKINEFENAARDGARAARGWNSNMSEVSTAVANTLSSAGLSPGSYTVVLADAAGNAVGSPTSIPAGTYFSVSVSTTWTVAGSGVRPLGVISGNKIVTSRCLMRKEY